jgi:hypothetical protein
MKVARASHVFAGTMSADQRVAEWLTEEASFEEADVGAAPSRTPATPAALQRSRRTPAAFASFAAGGPEARILEVAQALRKRIRRQPIAALAIAAGAGFVIGGAMSFRAGRLLLAAGARNVARELLKQLL